MSDPGSPSKHSGSRHPTGEVVCITTSVLLAFLAFLSVRSLTPSAVTADTPGTEFSTARALAHVESISAQPHPVGTRAHVEVSDYLLGELAKVGLQPQVQKTTAVNTNWGRPYRAATVQNVLARLAGTANTRAVMLVAHYDSVPNSFGAGDDGAAVAALLETLRALAAGPRLRNDVIVLFSDGEELGMLGAGAFVAEHPWAKDVGLVLNFEGRGTHGPSVMFQTSDGNGRLVGEFAGAAEHPVANSLSSAIYKLLPNDTDFTVFKDAGLAGFNFAFIEGFDAYHSSLDNAQDLDARSLQHHGLQALALTRRFGNINLKGEAGGGDAVYFDLWGSSLLHYSQGVAVALAVALTILAAVVIAAGLRRKFLTPSGVALGAVALLLSVGAAAALSYLVWRLVVAVEGSPASLPREDTHINRLYAAGFVALTIASASAIYSLFRRKLSVEDLAVGALLWFWGLLILSLVYLPGGSYLLTWPLAFGLAGWAYRFTAARRELNGAGLRMLFFPSAACGVVLLGPLAFQLFVAFGVDMIYAVAALTALLLGLFVVQFDLRAGARRWLLPAASAAVALCFVLVALLQPGFGGRRPQRDDLFYALNADTGRAGWASTDAQPDEWTSQFLSGDGHRAALTDYVPWMDTGEFLQHAAPVAPLPAPEVRVLEDAVEGGVRSLHLRVVSAREASALYVYVGSEIFDGTVGGKPLVNRAESGPDQGWILNYWAPPAEGVDLTFKTKSFEPLGVKVVDKTYQLPASESLSVSPRPNNFMPAPFTYSNSTFVVRSFSLPAPGAR